MWLPSTTGLPRAKRGCLGSSRPGSPASSAMSASDGKSKGTTLRGTDEMNDSQRHLEQKALRNVRALVDTLEREELGRGKRKKIVMGLVSVPVVVIVFALGVRAWNAPSEAAEKARHACALDGWNARAAAFMEANRLAHPE